MADLYHLLDELDENEANDAAAPGNNIKNNDRRLTVDTAVTETLSSEEEEDFEEGSPEVPAALQDAALEKDGNYGYADDENHLYDHVLNDKQKDRSKNTLMHDDEGEESELFLPNEMYEKLNRLWLQERHCPELLDYDEDMVQDLMKSFEEREETIDELSESNDAVQLLLSNLQQQDMDRAKFVLSDWLTQRLKKIESHPLHMRTKMDSMSEGEKEYLFAYGALMEHHLNSTVLDNIPQAWRALDDPEMIDQPDYESYHFWFLKESIVDQDEIDHEGGSCLIAKYLDMKNNMRENKVELLI